MSATYLAINGEIVQSPSSGGGGGGGGGSSGHNILDNEGNMMTARPDLQMAGYLQTTDDSTNEVTIVDDTPTPVTWAVWQTMTSAQKAGKKWLITNVPGAEGEVEIETMHLAWSNPSISADFPAGTITLDTDDYDGIIVEYILAKNAKYYSSVNVADVPASGTFIIPLANAWLTAETQFYQAVTFTRLLSRVSATQYSVSDAEQTYYNSNTKNNGLLIPVKIYTYKKTLTAKISAIAANVSTQADHCMLDENTSVKDMTQDSGWTTLNSYVRIRKIGKQVCIETKFVDSVITSTTWATFGTLPEGYRPSSNAFNCLLSHSNGNFQDVKFSTDGTIQVIGNVTVYGYTTYFVD